MILRHRVLRRSLIYIARRRRESFVEMLSLRHVIRILFASVDAFIRSTLQLAGKAVAELEILALDIGGLTSTSNEQRTGESK